MNNSIQSYEIFDDLNWDQIERDFRVESAQPTAPQKSPVYPLIEGAIWQLSAVDALLAALDERVTALDNSLQLLGEEQLRAQLQLMRAEERLFYARADFLAAAARVLSTPSKHSLTQNEAQLEAIGTLWDLEAAWSTRRLRPSA